MKTTLVKACASDLDVVNAARVSFAKRSNELQEGDGKLINFLLREKHGTPFEHGYFQFHVEAPIFVFREWHRHRAGHSYNEMSGRYVELEEKYYVPGEGAFAFREQHGKPGAYTFSDVPNGLKQRIQRYRMKKQNHKAFKLYRKLLKQGVAKEQARSVLPVSTYSQMIWSCNPRSLMHFIALRNAPNAMREIKELAAQAEEALKLVMPETHAAFIENGRVAP